MKLYDSQLYREDLAGVAGLDLNWNGLQDATVVISGVSGMIGSFLTDVLMTRNADYGLNCTVHGLARDLPSLRGRFYPYLASKNLVLTAADIRTDTVRIDSADYVIHAASNTHPAQYAQDPIGTITTNVQGTYSMLNLGVNCGARRVGYLSTVEIYGDNRDGVPRFTESDLGYIDCNTTRAGYPESKRTGEALCQAFASAHGLDVVIPRLPRIFGPTLRPTDTKALSQFLFKAVAGQDIVLKSEGNQFFSYCNVADAASA
ncbi:MAG: NAD-dependent epimerase/dehydratase family protein, partial [Propionibacteriaceae bacterium]|nr:NAD-dependent epimerase/dehydratase family protein [Propionibacteriaceae bacterium]